MIRQIVSLSLLVTAAFAAPVPQSPNEIQPLLVSSAVPEVTLNKADGTAVKLDKLCSEKPTVLIFYRGGWCPYCMRHLSALQDIEQDLLELGFQVVAVSADRPEKLQETESAQQVHYQLLSDNDMAAAKAFGIAFQVPEEIVSMYKEKYKIDLEADSGRTHHQLPVPAVFLVGSDGKIAFTHVNPDYRSRLDPQIILAAAQSAVAQ